MNFTGETEHDTPTLHFAPRVGCGGLLNRLSRPGKIHNPKQILLPAKDLRRF